MEELLKQFGFTDPQIQVYKALLKTGGDTVTNLANIIGLKRTSCQEYLRALQEAGFVNSTRVKNKFYYQAEDPDKFEQVVNERLFLVDRIIKDLEKDKKTAKPWGVRSLEAKEAELEIKRLNKKSPNLTKLGNSNRYIAVGENKTVLVGADKELPALEIVSVKIAKLHKNLLKLPRNQNV